jgi:hypothetical protein
MKTIKDLISEVKIKAFVLLFTIDLTGNSLFKTIAETLEEQFTTMFLKPFQKTEREEHPRPHHLHTKKRKSQANLLAEHKCKNPKMLSRLSV